MQSGKKEQPLSKFNLCLLAETDMFLRVELVFHFQSIYTYFTTTCEQLASCSERILFFPPSNLWSLTGVYICATEALSIYLL